MSTLTINGFWRPYNGQLYPRTILKFGDKEPVTVKATLLDAEYAPIPDTFVQFHVDGRQLGGAWTNPNGIVVYTFEKGIVQGTHVITVFFAGNRQGASCEDTAQITCLPMVESSLVVYVDNTSTSAVQIENQFMTSLLQQENIVVSLGCKSDPTHLRYIFDLAVVPPPEETTLFPWMIVAYIIIAVAAAFIVYEVTDFLYAYFIWGPRAKAMCCICKEWFPDCPTLRDHLITVHPTDWAKIETNWTCNEVVPPNLFDFKLLIYGGVAIAGIYLAAKIIGVVKKK